MKQIAVIALLTLAAMPAMATQQVSVPEMEIGAGFAAIALLTGIAAIIREKTKRK